jgi:type IX secretion system PorP/SprF family membrane protein
MKKKIIVIIAVFSSSFSVAQSYRYFNFFNYDPKLINPAFAGMVNAQDYQVQYSTIAKSNDSGTLSTSASDVYTALTAASIKIDKLNSGIGAIVWRDVTGPYGENNGSIMYNYQFKLGVEKCLSLGTQLGYSVSFIDNSKFTQIQPNNSLIIEGIEYGNRSFIADFGLAFQSHKLYVGISTINLLQRNEFKFPRSYNLYSAYEFRLVPWLKMQPSVLIAVFDYSKASTIRTSVDYSIKIHINEVFIVKDRFLLGVGDLFNDDGYNAMSVNAGALIIKKIQIMLGTSFRTYPSYSSNYQKIDAMLRFIIPNKNLLTQN